MCIRDRLYAVIALYVGGVLVELTVNGSNVMRVATILSLIHI